VTTACPSVMALSGSGSGSSHVARDEGPSEGWQLCVTAGHTDWPQLREVEQRLVATLALTSGRAAYVAQSDVAILGLGQEVEDSLEKFRRYAMPSNTIDDSRRFVRRSWAAFTDAESWIKSLAGCDLVLGCRFHGVMAGVLAGAPSLVLAPDARVWELALSSGVPVIGPAQYLETELLDLRDSIRSMGISGTLRMQEAQTELVQFLSGNQISISRSVADSRGDQLSDECALSREPGMEGRGSCRLRGRIEHGGEKISGWATCASHGEASVLALIRDGAGNSIAVRAMRFRSDLVRSGISNGFSGFSFRSQSRVKLDSLELVDAFGNPATR